MYVGSHSVGDLRSGRLQAPSVRAGYIHARAKVPFPPLNEYSRILVFVYEVAFLLRSFIFSKFSFVGLVIIHLSS